MEGETPLFTFKVRHRAGMTIAHQIAHFSSLFGRGVAPCTVIPAGRRPNHLRGGADGSRRPGRDAGISLCQFNGNPDVRLKSVISGKLC